MAIPEETGIVLGSKFAEALGLNAQMIKSITLKVTANEVATVVVEIYPDQEQFKEMIAVVEEYELVEIVKKKVNGTDKT